jgi:hypothetical protein
MDIAAESLFQKSESACFGAKAGMARRNERAYPTGVCKRGATKPDRPWRRNPAGGGSFGQGRCWLVPYSPLRGCSKLAALSPAKIPRRTHTRIFETGSERNFGLDRGATSEHIRNEVQVRSDNEPGQRSLSPEGFAENSPATLLFLSRRSIKDILLRHASSACCFGQNSNIQSFLTGCQTPGSHSRKT